MPEASINTTSSAEFMSPARVVVKSACLQTQKMEPLLTS